MTTDKETPYWEQDIAECLRVAAEIIGPNSYYLRAAEYIDEMRTVNGRLIRQLERQNADLLAALELIDSNAAESVEWIRRVARAAIRKSTGEI